MSKIILSYRRSDAPALAGRIFDRLVQHYGKESVFMDIDNIPFGADFRKHIQGVLSNSDIIIGVVGPKWLGARKRGKSRIHEEADYVRIEIETALQKGIPVVPVLVDRADMPKLEELPPSLHDFVYLNAAPIDDGRDFHQHVDRLIRSMDRLLQKTTSPQSIDPAPSLLPDPFPLSPSPSLEPDIIPLPQLPEFETNVPTPAPPDLKPVFEKIKGEPPDRQHAGPTEKPTFVRVSDGGPRVIAAIVLVVFAGGVSLIAVLMAEFWIEPNTGGGQALVAIIAFAVAFAVVYGLARLLWASLPNWAIPKSSRRDKQG